MDSSSYISKNLSKYFKRINTHINYLLDRIKPKTVEIIKPPSGTTIKAKKYQLEVKKVHTELKILENSLIASKAFSKAIKLKITITP